MKNFNWKALSLTCICAVFMVIGATDTFAYEDYDDGCIGCHSGFVGGSLEDGNLHGDHFAITSECTLCHVGFGGAKPVPVSLNPSDASGTGCAGCHGRLEDAGNDKNSNPGLGAGLRQYHETIERNCGGCHSDNAGYTPVGEHVLPPFYTAEGLDPCDDNLDNNGDGVKDVCDTNMIYGTISGLSGDAVTVDLYIVNCGIPDPSVGSPVTNAAGYYELGGLGSGQYQVLPDQEAGYSFAPVSVWANIPNLTGLSYDFTATAVD
jgi:hypothetical protein